MKQKISTLMDGELSRDEAEALLAKIRHHPEAQQEWSTYHLIGDVLRQPDYLAGNVNAAFLERLHAEPTILAPHSQRTSKAGFIAMSAAGLDHGYGLAGMAFVESQCRAGISAGAASKYAAE